MGDRHALQRVGNTGMNWPIVMCCNLLHELICGSIFIVSRRLWLCDRSFTVAGHHLWNMLFASLCLVDDFTHFKNLLKACCFIGPAALGDSLF